MCNRKIKIHDFEAYPDCNGCVKAIRDIKVPVDDVFFKCKFRNRVINCTEHFTETVVGTYLCYTFNDLGIYRQTPSVAAKLSPIDEDRWSSDGGYKKHAPVDVYPHRALKPGSKYGFSIILGIGHQYYDKVCDDGDTLWVGYNKLATCKSHVSDQFLRQPSSNTVCQKSHRK